MGRTRGSVASATSILTSVAARSLGIQSQQGQCLSRGNVTMMVFHARASSCTTLTRRRRRHATSIPLSLVYRMHSRSVCPPTSNSTRFLRGASLPLWIIPLRHPWGLRNRHLQISIFCTSDLPLLCDVDILLHDIKQSWTSGPIPPPYTS